MCRDNNSVVSGATDGAANTQLAAQRCGNVGKHGVEHDERAVGGQPTRRATVVGGGDGVRSAAYVQRAGPRVVDVLRHDEHGVAARRALRRAVIGLVARDAHEDKVVLLVDYGEGA